MILSPFPVFRWTDNNGSPAIGWLVETYIAGTSTPVTTYTDSTGTSTNTNPIILDFRGEANIWLDPSISYKYVIKNPVGAVQDTIDQITAGAGGTGGLTRVYYNDSASIAFSGLGSVATPLSASVKISSYPNNVLTIRPDGLYAVGTGGGGSVAWGGITGNINDQTDLINKFNTYLPLTFASPQVLTYTAQGQFVFANAGEFVAQNLAVGASQNNFVSLMPDTLSVRFVSGSSGNDSRLVASVVGAYTWNLPDASGTIALTSSLGDYIKRDGTSTTTATIPFAVGASFGDAPSGLAIQLTGSAKWIGSGTSPTTGGSALLLDSTSWILRSNTGNTISTSTNNITYNNNAGSHTFQSSGTNLYSFNLSVHAWDGGIGGSTAKYQFNGTAHIASTLRIGSIPTGTQVGLVGYDANGNLIQGSGGGGSYMTISGHNDLTTPWSAGDGATWGTSQAGLQIDPVGAYGFWIKGNTLIEQGVSQALTLYKATFSGDVCLRFDAQDTLGNQSSYAEICGRIVDATSGSVDGAIDFDVAINNSITTLMSLSDAALSISRPITGTGATFTSSVQINGATAFYRSNRPDDDSVARTHFFATRGDGSGQAYSINTRSTSANNATSVLHNLDGVNVFDFSKTALTVGVATTFSGLVSTPASTTTTAGIRIPHGTAPSAPVNGDMWSTTTSWLVRTNGATQTIAMLENAQTFSAIKTFSATPVISSTTASTTAGAIYKRTNYGHIGYEAGMAQEFNSCIYTAPVGTALTNSTTETDVNGGTALFGTRTLSNVVMQIGVWFAIKARVKYTNTAANTLTLRLRWSTIAGTVLATAVLTRVNAGAEIFDVIFRGIASAAPSASSATSWTCDVAGNSTITANAVTTSTEATLATSTATPLILTAQWTSALATSSVQILNSEICLD